MFGTVTSPEQHAPHLFAMCRLLPILHLPPPPRPQPASPLLLHSSSQVHRLHRLHRLQHLPPAWHRCQLNRSLVSARSPACHLLRAFRRVGRRLASLASTRGVTPSPHLPPGTPEQTQKMHKCVVCGGKGGVRGTNPYIQ